MRKHLKIIILFAVVAALVCACAGCTRLEAIFISNEKTTSIELCSITKEFDVYAYTGEEIKPKVTVTYSGIQLTEGTDYTLSYSDNIQIGTGKITISGKGKYSGSQVIEFSIVSEVYVYNFKCAYPAEYLVVGDDVQIVSDKSQLQPPTFSAKGYSFVGWYVLPDLEVDFDSPDTLPDGGGDIWALFELNNYTITYAGLDGADNSPLNPDVYTYEDRIELFAAADKDGEYFAGWYLDEEYTERITTIEKGSMGNFTLYAKYIPAVNNYKITYNAPSDADFVEFEFYAPGAELSDPDVKSDDGKRELVWYTDENCTHRYVFRTMPNEDVILYSRWEDVLDTGFLDRVDDNSIDSFDELVEYIEYVCYENITISSAETVDVTYVSGKTNINNEISKAADECNYPRIGSITFDSTYDSTTIYMTSDLSSIEATVTGTAVGDRYPQYEDVLFNPQSSRSADYDDFAINYVDETYECSTSNQLFYVLAHGYRPLPTAGSRAESVYEDFKDIMRSIVDDDMTDLQKVTNIYSWLITNVYYDNYVAAHTGDDYYKYKAFYLEGVLEGSAVCDGLSKAFTVMCAIEGIDCVRVTGVINGQNVGHAWNKVQVLGDWYLTDATWGNTVFRNGSEEYLVYDYLLFTDDDREDDGYVSRNYTEYATPSSQEFSKYDTFDSFDLTVSGQTVDLLISDATELSYVLEYVCYECDDVSGKTLNIMLENTCDVQELFNDAKRLLGTRGIRTSIAWSNMIVYGNALTTSSGEYLGGTTLMFVFA